MADQAGLPAWLEASAKGRRLYRKLGFNDVEDIVIDLSEYGGEGVETTVCMLRKASNGSKYNSPPLTEVCG
jgi:hypothetical protein